mmetsp:Transcript_7887/g.14315  ORF Transcript_7887/g.14315 Transcript_7887/m.14315 type:complete len:226 (-) Transcript_7887:363-1040(-)
MHVHLLVSLPPGQLGLRLGQALRQDRLRIVVARQFPQAASQPQCGEEPTPHRVLRSDLPQADDRLLVHFGGLVEVVGLLGPPARVHVLLEGAVPLLGEGAVPRQQPMSVGLEALGPVLRPLRLLLRGLVEDVDDHGVDLNALILEEQTLHGLVDRLVLPLVAIGVAPFERVVRRGQLLHLGDEAQLSREGLVDVGVEGVTDAAGDLERVPQYRGEVVEGRQHDVA